MKICMLTYRGNPFCGGQGVYVSHLARELVRQGHEVHCITGPPYPAEEDGVIWHRVPGLLLYGENGGYPPPHSPLSKLRIQQKRPQDHSFPPSVPIHIRFLTHCKRPSCKVSRYKKAVSSLPY